MKKSISDLQHIKRRDGIYALKKEGVIVYIGQSTNVYCRLLEHIIDGVKDFDDVKALYHNSRTSIEINEVVIIGLLKPKYNKLVIDFDLFYNILPKSIHSQTREELKNDSISLINELKKEGDFYGN